MLLFHRGSEIITEEIAGLLLPLFYYWCNNRLCSISVNDFPPFPLFWACCTPYVPSDSPQSMAITACRVPICIFTIVRKIFTVWAVLLVLTNVPVQEQPFRATHHCGNSGKAELHVAVPAMGALVVPNLPALWSVQLSILNCCCFITCVVIKRSELQTENIYTGSVPLYTVRRSLLWNLGKNPQCWKPLGYRFSGPQLLAAYLKALHRNTAAEIHPGLVPLERRNPVTISIRLS